MDFHDIVRDGREPGAFRGSRVRLYEHGNGGRDCREDDCDQRDAALSLPVAVQPGGHTAAANRNLSGHDPDCGKFCDGKPVMRAAMIRRRTHRYPKHGERGVTMILVVLAMLSMLGIIALAIDVITLYSARSEAQRAADSAAL